MKTVYFIRHGETDGNASNLFQHSDISLSEKGKEQAKRIAERCRSLDAEIIISSTMARAQQTAEAIAAETQLSVESSADLREVAVPSALIGQDKNGAEAEKFNHYLENFLYQEPDEKFEDAENYSEVIGRVQSVFKMLEAKPEEKIIVVSHGRFLRSVFAFVLANQGDARVSGIIDTSMKMMDNTAVSVLQFGQFEPDKWLLSIYNDQAHFAE